MYELKHRWRDGSAHVVFEPMELLEKLAALVPAPRFNLIRYHGVLAPAARWRRLIVPSDPTTETAGDPAHPACTGCGRGKSKSALPRNYTWSELLRRVFALDVLQCSPAPYRERV